MSLSKETIERLRILEAAILAQPQFYKQDKWVSKIEPCGTTCCLAGWADFIFNGKKVHEARAKRLSLPTDVSFGAKEWSSIAGQALGLTECQTESLVCSPDCWPDPYSEDYLSATSAKQRAEIAVDRIEHFIATGGEE